MSSQLLLGSVHASAAFNPHASVNLLSRARATSHGIDMTSSITQLSVTISRSANSAATTPKKNSNIPRPYNTEECTITNVNGM